jgi:plastocyanin
MAAAALAAPLMALAVPAASAAPPAQAPVLASAASASAGTNAHHAVAKRKKIKGKVGPDFTISVKPGTVKAGKVKMIVKDKGTIHNFHITGPGGVDKATSVPGTGKTVWKLKLVPGVYDIVCDPHSDMMHTTLTVT